MSKEKKDLLKTILANTELIMAHLNIKNSPKTSAKEVKAPAKKILVKGTKKPAAKK